ncbi:SUKH-4 family immunity protein [Kitasatospora sp. NPDC101157]|uniref:SUKH-4 family immunity protein n=1 Tax=Kitasatospora sp. NPDC101157 TaxID=3364098 RepID=UPI003804C68D
MRERIREVLGRPLSELVVPGDRAAAEDPSALRRWAVAAHDREALERWGLPVAEECGLVSNIHEGERPEELADGRRYYGLGLWLDVEVAAAIPSGQVWGVPLTSWRPSARFINSSISVYVDAAWRWYWVLGIVNSEDSVERWSCLRDFFGFIADRDPGVAQRRCLWHEVLLSD